MVIRRAEVAIRAGTAMSLRRMVAVVVLADNCYYYYCSYFLNFFPSALDFSGLHLLRQNYLLDLLLYLLQTLRLVLLLLLVILVVA